MSYSYDNTPFVRPAEHTHSNAWMISFADLLSLMLTFFILMFSMSEVRNKEWYELTSSLNATLNPANKIIRFEEEQKETQPLKPVQSGLHLSYLYNLLSEQLGSHATRYFTIISYDNEIVISLKSDALFSPASADFSEDGVKQVEYISTAIATLPNKVEIKGHSDPTPINTLAFPSNWALSLARSDAVATLISSAGYTRPIDRFGLADSQFNSFFLNKPMKQRNKLARRVDIVIKADRDY